MAVENETVEVVLREIDEAHETWKRSEIANLPTQYLKEWHDRIEAAHKREIAELRAKLKIADDALRKLQERFVSSVYDGTIDPHEALKIAEDALAAIRKEGGVK